MRIFEQPPAVVGHRGAGESAVSGLPENSVESCLVAHEQGASWVEIDARLTADDELILHHDHVLPDGTPVDEASAATCRAQGLTGFDELLAALPEGLGVDLEVKVALGDTGASAPSSTAGRVAARAAELASTRPVVVTSFSPAALVQARAVAGDRVPVGLLGMPFTPLGDLIASAVALEARLIAPHVLLLGLVEVAGLPIESPRRVEQALEVARHHGCEVLVWGVRSEQAAELAALGVDALCVDEIEATRAALGHPASD